MKKALIFVLFLFSFLLSVDAKTSLKIIPINTGENGDCTLLESNGKYMLIDMCENSHEKIFQYLEDNNIHQLDVMISHMHGDHVGLYDGSNSGLTLLLNNDAITINNLYLPNVSEYQTYLANTADRNSTEVICDASHFNANSIYTRGDIYRLLEYEYNKLNNYATTATDKGINVVTANVGTKFNFGDAKIEIIGPLGTLNPYSTAWEIDRFNHTRVCAATALGAYMNNNSIVARITTNNFTYLTAGDIQVEEENILLNSNVNLSADIMKLSHHGGYTSNLESFIKKVNPKYAFYNRKSDPSYWIQDIFPGVNSVANVYSQTGNGNLAFEIDDKGDINVVPTANFKSVTLKYVDEDNNELVASKEYRFNAINYNFYDEAYDLKIYFPDFAKNVRGYRLVTTSSDLPKTLSELGDASEIKVRYTKISNTSTPTNNDSGQINTETNTEDKESKPSKKDNNKTKVNEAKTTEQAPKSNNKVNPNTGYSLSIVLVLLSLLIGSITIVITKKKKRIIKL